MTGRQDCFRQKLEFPKHGLDCFRHGLDCFKQKQGILKLRLDCLRQRFKPRHRKTGEGPGLGIMLVTLFIIEALLGVQGFCMADEGWSLTGYQQIFREPESVKYMFLFYNPLWIGGIWEMLFGWMGMYGFRLLNVLFMLGTWTIIYRLLRNYVSHTALFIGFLLVVAAHDYGVMVFDHSSVTVLLSAAAAYCLFRALHKSSCPFMLMAGILLAMNVFSRIPNLTQLILLALLIPYYIYTHRGKQTLKLLGFALLGLAVGVAIEVGLMAAFGHLPIFIDNLSTGMSAATSADSSHNLGSMIVAYLQSYVQIVKDMLKIGLLPLLASIVISRRQVKLRSAAVLLGITLFALQAAILIHFFDNMLFLYSFISLVLFPSIYFLRKDRNRVYLILTALLILYSLPYGSDFGINNMGENAIWMAAPLSIGLAVNQLKASKAVFRHIGFIALTAFIAVFFIKNGWHIMNNAYFDEGSRLEKTCRIQNVHANTLTKKSYAEATMHLLDELKKYVSPGDYLFCFQSSPTIHYITHTRPYMYNPWPWSFDTASMRLHLQRAEASSKVCPVLVREKTQIIDFTKPDPYWDSTDATDNFSHKNAKVEIIHGFIRRHGYHVVWEDNHYQILLPESMAHAIDTNIE